MNTYFLYRINVDYDGFLPCRIPWRAHRRCILYNWRAYVETLEPGDIVLTYFSGRGCRKGIFAVAKILRIRIGVRNENVVGRLLGFSSDNDKPLIDAQANPILFRNLRGRCRGAELVIPDHLSNLAHRLLSESGAIAAAPGMSGSELDQLHSLRDVPPVNSNYLSKRLRKKGVVATYWIRPSQATWMTKAPEWLQRITRIFHRLKAGDLSHLESLALALAKRVLGLSKHRKEIGVLLSVPLSEQKQRSGEVDRVRELAKRVSAILSIPYSHSLSLKGKVSRRLFKKRRLPDDQFRDCYQRNLRIRRTRRLMNCIKSGRAVLLIDDVYTDGVTTEAVRESLKRALGEQVSVSIATLGIMAKARNINESHSAAWRSGGEPSRETGAVASG